jgi:hypothetical protein
MLKAPNSSFITDITEKYKDKTFSGYKKTQVFQQLKESILKGEIDKACFWGCEMDASNFTQDVWKKLLLFACKEINCANPNLPGFLLKRYKEFQALELEWTKQELRNCQESRNRLCELICVLTLSPKKKFPKYCKIKESDFQLETLKTKMIARNQIFILKIVHPNIPLEIRIALNEFANYLLLSKRGTQVIQNSFWWVDWLVFYDKIYKKIHGHNLECQMNISRKEIDQKYIHHFIWYVWDIIFEVLLQKQNIQHFYFLKGSIENLYSLYILDFKKGNVTSKMCYIKFAVLLLLNSNPIIQYNKPIFNQSQLCIKACANINYLYTQLMDNKSNYLYKLKEQQLLEQAKCIPETVETQQAQKKNVIQRMLLEKEFSKHINKTKYGRERLEDEVIQRKQLQKYYNMLYAKKQTPQQQLNLHPEQQQQRLERMKQLCERNHKLQYLKYKSKIKKNKNLGKIYRRLKDADSKLRNSTKR